MGKYLDQIFHLNNLFWKFEQHLAMQRVLQCFAKIWRFGRLHEVMVLAHKDACYPNSPSRPWCFATKAQRSWTMAIGRLKLEAVELVSGEKGETPENSKHRIFRIQVLPRSPVSASSGSSSLSLALLWKHIWTKLGWNVYPHKNLETSGQSWLKHLRGGVFGV